MTFVDKFSDEWYRYTSERKHNNDDGDNVFARILDVDA